MSLKTKEKFWIEFRICSDINGDSITPIKISEQELNIKDNSGRRNFGHITRRTAPLNLFENKFPIYLKDAISQVFQEIEVESNPAWIKILLDKKADKLFSKGLSEIGLELAKSNKEERYKIKIRSKDEHDFYIKLKRKASISELDKAIIKSEDDLSTLAYLLDGISILKNSVFLDLFQNWFETALKAEKIDELIYNLKKKMNLIKPGPKGFSPREVMRIIYRYEYLRIIFSKIKKEIKEPYNEDEALKEWAKLEAFLKENNYFNIDREIVISKLIEIPIGNEKMKKLIGKEKIKARNIKKDHRALEYLGQNWLKKNVGFLKEIYLINRKEAEIKDEIFKYQISKILNTYNEEIERKARCKFLESFCESELNRKEYYDLKLDITSESYSFKYLYQKHHLEKLGDLKKIEHIIDKIKKNEFIKIIKNQKINIEPYIQQKSINFIKKNKPSELAIISLSKINDLTYRQIKRLIEDYNTHLRKIKKILSYYPHLN